MASQTHVLIEALVASGTPGAMEIDNIPGTYTDLELVWSFQYNSYSPTTQAGHNAIWRINDVTTNTVYPYLRWGVMYGTGDSSTHEDTATSHLVASGFSSTTSDHSACGRMMFFDYANSAATGKSIQSFHSSMKYSADSYDKALMASSGNLNLAAAITSIKAYGDSSFKDGSYMRLYGISRS
tara:strand:- start:47 stop:592 length:546 start_codon:yes stop_codon:yes gene_type:complete